MEYSDEHLQVAGANSRTWLCKLASERERVAQFASALQFKYKYEGGTEDPFHAAKRRGLKEDAPDFSVQCHCDLGDAAANFLEPHH